MCLEFCTHPASGVLRCGIVHGGTASLERVVINDSEKDKRLQLSSSPYVFLETEVETQCCPLKKSKRAEMGCRPLMPPPSRSFDPRCEFVVGAYFHAG